MNEKQNIKIGILEQQHGWITLLDQIGVHWEVVDFSTKDLLFEFSVIVVNRTLDNLENDSIQQFIKDGGAAIFTNIGSRFFNNIASSLHYIKSLPPTNKEQYQFHSILDIYDTCTMFSKTNIIHTEEYGNGFKSIIGIDIERIFQKRRRKRKNFYSLGTLFPSELVSSTSFGSLRELVTTHLEFLHRKRNLPFVHKWYFPTNHRSIFTFRIDTDKGTQSQIEDIYELSEKYNIPTTWFLDVKSHERWLAYFKKFTLQEIGIHCYEHIVHNSKILNEENFLKAMSKLSSITAKIKGIAAPTGRWNSSLQSAFETLGFEYSSEFGYDYDNLPSYPWSNGRKSTVMQIPIHPVCIGSMLRAKMTPPEMFNYFRNVIDQNLLIGEPICLYHHPTHANNDVFEKVFQYISEKKIIPLSFTQYCAWWKTRLGDKFRVSYTMDEISFEASANPDVWCRIVMPDGKESIVQRSNIIKLNELDLNIKEKPSINSEIMSSRKFDWKHLIYNFLDWWVRITE
jgi:hypothetical protein